MKTISRKTIEKTYTAIDGYWYRVYPSMIHTCCRCKKSHTVDFKWKKNRLYFKWVRVIVK